MSGSEDTSRERAFAGLEQAKCRRAFVQSEAEAAQGRHGIHVVVEALAFLRQDILQILLDHLHAVVAGQNGPVSCPRS